MLAKAEQYRANAQACAERARAARDADVRQLYLELAQNWLFIAEQMERRPFFEAPETHLSQKPSAD